MPVMQMSMISCIRSCGVVILIIESVIDYFFYAKGRWRDFSIYSVLYLPLLQLAVLQRAISKGCVTVQIMGR